MKRDAYLFTALEGNKVQCNTCQRRCLIPPGRTGWCGTRVNEGGRLSSLIYGEVSSLSINPIEKKPVFHFFPGSRWLSLGSVGCNFRCPGCQNWEIAHWQAGPTDTEYLSPEDAVSQAKKADCLGISWTFNEPALWFEYTLDSAKVAKEQGLYTNYVTNGYLSREALDRLAPHLDVFRVDIKGFSDRTYSRIGHIAKFSGILDVTERAKEKGLHVEVVTNVIPGYNDDVRELRDLAAWVKTSLGQDTPWHVTRFHPHHDLSRVPATPVDTLERIRDLGREVGLWYVYLGNVPGHKGENTRCHKCGELLIERHIFDVLQNKIKNSACPACGTVIPGRFAS